MVLGCLLVGSTPVQAEPVKLAVDSKRSQIHFTAYQALAKTRGTFRRWSGTFQLDPDDPTAHKARVEIETASIDTGLGIRDGHLREPERFDVKRHPKIVFEARTFKPAKDGRMVVSGTITAKGRKTPVTMKLSISWSGTPGSRKVRVKGWTLLDRNELGLDFKAPWYVPAIKNKVAFSLEIVLVQKR